MGLLNRVERDIVDRARDCPERGGFEWKDKEIKLGRVEFQAA